VRTGDRAGSCGTLVQSLAAAGALPWLERVGREHEMYRFDAGHGSLVSRKNSPWEVALDLALRHVCS
jgi:hypothetical protein